MQNDKVFFKIVVPNYNNMAYIKQCLDSILSQTCQDFKIIVVDDLSDDLSYELAKSYEWEHPDKVVVLRADKKRYAGGCRNIGINYPLDCEYYYFLDSDDFLYNKQSLQTIYKNLSAKPDMLLFSFNFLDQNGTYRSSTRSKCDFKKFKGKYAVSGWNSASARVVKSYKIKYFLENCMRAEDTFQWLTILDEQPSIRQIKDEIFTYRLHAKSATHNKIFVDDRPKLMMALKDLKTKCKTKDVIDSINHRLGIEK